MNSRLIDLYRRDRRRYVRLAAALLMLGACGITTLWGVLAARTYGLDQGEAVLPVAITVAQGATLSIFVLWLRRAEIHSMLGWDPATAGVENAASRSALLEVVLRFPWRFAMTTLAIGPLIAGPTIATAFASTVGFNFDDVMLAVGGGMLGVVYAAAYVYSIWELVLGPLRAELGVAITREQRNQIGSRSLMAKLILGLAITAVVLGFIAGVLIADPDSSFAEGARIVVIAIAAAVIVGGSLAIPLAKGALAPIDHLIAGTRSVAAGQLETQVPVTTTDEFAELVLSFNEMVAGLREREELRSRNVELLDDVRRQAEQLAASRARIVAASDEARRNVERDLHDGAQQSLVMLNLKLGQLERKLAGDASGVLVADAKADLNRALDELRDLAHGIYPQVLTSDGLPGALAEAAEQASIPTTVDSDGATRYAPEVEAAVYFCCLEALQNAAKHAGESTVATVRLSASEAELRFEVADDGGGFDPSAVDGSAGLQNMADRIGALGGELSVESQTGHGTRVSGTVPVGG